MQVEVIVVPWFCWFVVGVCVRVLFFWHVQKQRVARAAKQSEEEREKTNKKVAYAPPLMSRRRTTSSGRTEICGSNCPFTMK